MIKEQNKERQSLRESVTQDIIQMMEAGTAPWQKDWDGKIGVNLMKKPMNAVTKTPYHGANAMMLFALGQAKDQGEDPRWCTYKQAQDKGWQVKKGSKATTVEYWKFTDDLKIKNEETNTEEKIKVKRKVPVVFYAKVFHASQVEGIPPYEGIVGYEHENPIQYVEEILKQSTAKIFHDQGDRAFYIPSTDEIHLPPKEAFPKFEGYYATALHELGHWTGHETRLNRNLENSFGTPAYAREELRAEMASVYLSMETGIPFDTGNHAAYTKSWIAALKNDKNEFFRAASDAEQIADYVIGLAIKQEVKQEAKKDVFQKEPWQMNHEEFNETMKSRIDHIPAISFATYIKSKGYSDVDLASDKDYAEFLGGIETKHTAAGKGKLKSIAQKISLTDKLYKNYENDLISGVIARISKENPLNFTSKADQAYVRMKHKRIIIEAIKAGNNVPAAIVAEYPELQQHMAEGNSLVFEPQETQVMYQQEYDRRLDKIINEQKNKTLAEQYRQQCKNIIAGNISNTILDNTDVTIAHNLILTGQYALNSIQTAIQKNSPMAVTNKTWGCDVLKEVKKNPAFKKGLKKVQGMER